MKNVVLFSFIILLVALPAMAADSISDWVTEGSNVAWAATPTDYQQSATSGESILWVGPIEETNVYFDDKNEIVIEFYCQHLSLENSGPAGLVAPIQAKDLKTGYFVVALQTPSLPVEQALQYCKEVKETPHFVAVLGMPVGPSSSFGNAGIYVQSEKIVMSDKLQVDILE